MTGFSWDIWNSSPISHQRKCPLFNDHFCMSHKKSVGFLKSPAVFSKTWCECPIWKWNKKATERKNTKKESSSLEWSWPCVKKSTVHSPCPQFNRKLSDQYGKLEKKKFSPFFKTKSTNMDKNNIVASLLVHKKIYTGGNKIETVSKPIHLFITQCVYTSILPVNFIPIVHFCKCVQKYMRVPKQCMCTNVCPTMHHF